MLLTHISCMDRPFLILLTCRIPTDIQARGITGPRIIGEEIQAICSDKFFKV